MDLEWRKSGLRFSSLAPLKEHFVQSGQHAEFESDTMIFTYFFGAFQC